MKPTVGGDGKRLLARLAMESHVHVTRTDVGRYTISAFDLLRPSYALEVLHGM
jgi:hypothetical protein